MTHDILGEDSALALETTACVVGHTGISTWAFWATYLLEELEGDQAPAENDYIGMLENLVAMCVHRIDTGAWE